MSDEITQCFQSTRDETDLNLRRISAAKKSPNSIFYDQQKSSNPSTSDVVVRRKGDDHKEEVALSNRSLQSSQATPPSSGRSILSSESVFVTATTTSSSSTNDKEDPKMRHLTLKIEKTTELIDREQKKMDENVQEYLKLSNNITSNANTSALSSSIGPLEDGAESSQTDLNLKGQHQLLRLKQLFEKKNQSSTQTINHLQQKLLSYERRRWIASGNASQSSNNASVQSSHISGTSSSLIHSNEHGSASRYFKSHGLRTVRGNIRDGLSEMSNSSIFNKSKEFAAQLLNFNSSTTFKAGQSEREGSSLKKNKFGSADNINKSSSDPTKFHHHRRILDLVPSIGPRNSNSGPSKVHYSEDVGPSFTTAPQRKTSTTGNNNRQHHKRHGSASIPRQTVLLLHQSSSKSPSHKVNVGSIGGSIHTDGPTKQSKHQKQSDSMKGGGKSNKKYLSPHSTVIPSSSKGGGMGRFHSPRRDYGSFPRCSSDVAEISKKSKNRSKSKKNKVCSDEKSSVCSNASSSTASSSGSGKSSSSSSCSVHSMSKSEAAVQATFDSAVARLKRDKELMRIKNSGGSVSPQSENTTVPLPSPRRGQGVITHPHRTSTPTTSNSSTSPSSIIASSTAATALQQIIISGGGGGGVVSGASTIIGSNSSSDVSGAVTTAMRVRGAGTTGGGGGGGHSQEWVTVVEELTLHKEEVDRMREDIAEMKMSIKQDFENIILLLRKYTERTDTLERQLIDMSELHRHELSNFKCGVAEMEERLVYQSDVRMREVHDHFLSLDTKLSSLQHQQNQHQLQYLNLEGLENSDARAVMMKLLTAIITVLHILLYVMATVMSIIRPFVSTALRAFITLAFAFIFYASYGNNVDEVAYLLTTLIDLTNICLHFKDENRTFKSSQDSVEDSYMGRVLKWCVTTFLPHHYGVEFVSNYCSEIKTAGSDP